MSFIFSQALEAAFSQANCSETDASVPLSTSPTPKPCLWHDKTMEPSRLSRFGMTCAPLTEDRGAELLMWFAEASRVRTSALQGGARELTVNAPACGEKWRGSLAKYDPASCSWRTAQLSLLEDSTACSVTWPRWGLMRNGECWERPTSAPRISESASGLWPTPTRDSATERTQKYAQGGTPLTVAVQARAGMWQTPVADDSVNRQIGKWNSRGEPKLSAQVMFPAYWPTPTVCGNYNRKGASASSGDGLATAVAQRTWPTATATAYKGWSPNHNRASSDDRLDYTVERENFQPGQQTPPMRLNPEWVEWLMGWPIGHTGLKPLETGRYREWLQQHSPCCPSVDEVAA